MASSSKPAPTVGGSAQQNEIFVVRLSPRDASYTNALEYLRAICHQDLPRTIRDCLNNDVEMDYYIAHDLRTAQVRRLLAFKPGLDPGNFKQFSTLRPWYNIHAAFIYITGDDNAPACQFKVKGVIRDGPCASIFAGCVVPRQDLNYTSGAKFNTTACANHQYQCEGSKCVRGGVAQTKHQPTIAQAQSNIAQAQPPAAPTTAAHGQVPTVQPGGPQYGSTQTPQGTMTFSHHVAPTSAASVHGPPAQAPSFQSHYVGAGPAQGYAYHDHTAQDHGAPYENYGDPILYSEQFTDVNASAEASGLQAFQLAASTQNASSQIVTSRAPTGQAHPSAAYMSSAYPAQDQSVSPNLIFGPHYARQIQAAGMDQLDQDVLDDNVLENPPAEAAQDDPDLEVLQPYLDGSHEEFHDNDGDLQM